MPVSLGDTILVKASDIDAEKQNPITVSWSQSFSERNEKYVQTTFKIVGGGNAGAEGVIFIQLSKVDAFKNKHVSGQPDITVVVDKDFQYGQRSKDGTGRWLAFHNKDNKAYQHRFIAPLLKKGADTVKFLAGKLGFPAAEFATAVLSNILGDYLHNF